MAKEFLKLNADPDLINLAGAVRFYKIGSAIEVN